MSRTLIRYAGQAAVLGGALYIATFGTDYLIYGLFEKQTQGTFVRGYALYAPMYAALSLGLYLRQRDYSGLRARRASHRPRVLARGRRQRGDSGYRRLTGGEAGVFTRFVTHVLAHVSYAAGLTLFGIATFRAGVMPKAAAVMVAAGPAWQFVPSLGGADRSYLLPSFAVTALEWMWLGYVLLAGREREAGSPRAV